MFPRNERQHLLCVQFPITALREIKILQLLKHENVVNLIEICRTKGGSSKSTRCQRVKLDVPLPPLL